MILLTKQQLFRCSRSLIARRPPSMIGLQRLCSPMQTGRLVRQEQLNHASVKACLILSAPQEPELQFGLPEKTMFGLARTDRTFGYVSLVV